MEAGKKEYITPEVEVIKFEVSTAILDMSQGGEW